MKKTFCRTAVALLCVWLLTGNIQAAQMLIPGGQVVGLRLRHGAVTVAAFDEQCGMSARNAGIEIGDTILSIDGRAVASAEELLKALEQSDGRVEIAVCRNGKTKTLTAEPAITPEGPRLGIYLRDGVTGIGTVSWYDPSSGRFGALGHGVNGPDGKLLNMTEGTAYEASVVSVKKGNAGDPGQLRGALETEQVLGTLYRNTQWGVFGICENSIREESLPVAAVDEIKTGNAVIRATVSGTAVREYSVNILKIYPNTRSNGRNLLFRVTDPQLLEITGGIVQGMSGSPLVQDGKLIGAVTHVLVNDPTMGYGIFIENMLDAAG